MSKKPIPPADWNPLWVRNLHAKMGEIYERLEMLEFPDMDSRLKDLDGRVARLEAQRGETSANTAKCRHSDSSGLVERVMAKLDEMAYYDTPTKRPTAKAVLRAVADWCEEYGDQNRPGVMGGYGVAKVLRAELEKSR